MKKVLLVAVMAVFMVCANAQSNDSIQFQSKFLYCQIVGTGNLFGTKVKIDIDYGQEVSFWKQDRRLRGDDGKSVKFNSMVDALNYMGTEGWEFVQAYVITVPSMGGGQNVYHWLLKREIKK